MFERENSPRSLIGTRSRDKSLERYLGSEIHRQADKRTAIDVSWNAG